MTTAKINTMDNGMQYADTTSGAWKHPSGGYLRGEAYPNGLGVMISDTRKFSGKRRSVRAVVFQRGSLGWEVAFNPGENHKTAGQFKTLTAYAAYELALETVK